MAKASKGKEDMPGKAATAPKPKTTQVTVEATDMGYYDHARRRVGDVFIVEEADISQKWMKRVPDGTPVQVTTAQQALRQQQADTVAPARATASPTTGTDRDVL